jgi:hypothetical protein
MLADALLVKVKTPVVDFYTKTSEESRLWAGSSQLEFERTKELIRRCRRDSSSGCGQWPVPE